MGVSIGTITPIIPLRLFTRANVGSLSLTPGAEESGAWFGPAGYVREYERLWDVG